MRAEWTLVTGPTIEPITIAEAKAQLRISTDDENGLLSSYIKAARETAEQSLNRGLLTQTWKLELGQFYDDVSLPMAAPLQSVTHVKYYDADGVLQTLSASVYTVDTTARPGRILLAPDQSWPAVQTERGAGVVQMTYVVGFTTAALVPERIRQGIRMYLSYLHMDRDGMTSIIGNTDQGDVARRAAEACWVDRCSWIPPDCR